MTVTLLLIGELCVGVAVFVVMGILLWRKGRHDIERRGQQEIQAIRDGSVRYPSRYASAVRQFDDGVLEALQREQKGASGDE